jgi:hypothetical protein
MLSAFLVIAALQSPSADPTLASSVQKQLRADDQALLDAIAPGDKTTWDRLLAQDAVYVDENGTVMDRAQFLAALKPLPAGSSGHIAIVDYQAHIHGQVALIVHKAIKTPPKLSYVIRRDAGNKIVDFVDRREGEDLVFVRGE